MEFLVVVTVITVIFVLMVRRAKRREAELFRRLDEAEGKPYWKPQPLTQAQRRALERKRLTSPTGVLDAEDLGLSLDLEPARAPTTPARPTRAIREGWRIGTVEFTYEDADGDITVRTVTVHSVNDAYLIGECHARRAERTFRLDRIIGQLTDCDTGELLDPEEWSERRQFS
ncbi:WYL domain-containing protein [Pseudomonas nitroreducens]|uniref:WYL domain-containing protein n=1 Tax=Pseudomonas nitroreducens TaxID=46680 RepID=UPI003818A0FA